MINIKFSTAVRQENKEYRNVLIKLDVGFVYLFSVMLQKL